MKSHPQTWDVLDKLLGEVVYTRDPLPEQYARFVLHQNAEENYAVLYIFTYNPNSYNPEAMRLTRHEFVVPCATYNKESWTRWLFDNILSIETHETAECFQINGKRVYAPHHGNGWDPYVLWYDGHPEEQAKSPGDS